MYLTKEEFLNLKIVSLVEPTILKINNHPKIPYVSSIQILTNNFKLQKIGDIINYWKNKNFEDDNLNDINWMYVYCMKYGFLKNLDKKNINIYGSWQYTDRKYNLTREQADDYLSKLEKMNNNEIEILMNIPFNVNRNNTIDDGTHRCCCMIGRLIREEEYITINITPLKII